MAVAMTFTTLQTMLQSYLERGTPSDTTVYQSLPQLINTAERAIARQFKIQGFIQNVVNQLQAGMPVYQKPDRWRLTVSMNYGTVSTLDPNNQNFREPIFPRSLEYCQTYWPDQSLTGPPEFYADYSYSYWLIVPTPDIAYPWSVNYYQLPPLLDASNQTNWLTDFCPNLLLYRALLECTPFLKDDERVNTWRQFYQEELAAVTQEDMQKAADRSTTRNES